jgi:SAM-dependent methyltransferase
MEKRERQHLSVREGYDLWASTYGTTESALVALDSRHCLRILEPQAGELVLDAGCGSGRHVPSLLAAGAVVVGIDFSTAMLARAQTETSGSHLAVADLQAALPFRDETFDAVLCSLVGEHLGDIVSAMTELRRVLKPTGRMVFTVIHPDQVEAGIEANFELGGIEYGLGAERHSAQNYLDAVVDAGFGDIAFASFRGGVEAGRFSGQPLLFLMAATASSPVDAAGS